MVVKKCGAMMGYDSGGLARRDAVLAYLAAADGSGGYRPFRVGGSGDVQGWRSALGIWMLWSVKTVLLRRWADLGRTVPRRGGAMLSWENAMLGSHMAVFGPMAVAVAVEEMVCRLLFFN